YSGQYFFLARIWREAPPGSNPWGASTTLTQPGGGFDPPYRDNRASPFPYLLDKNAPFAPRGLSLTQKPDMKTLNVYSWNLSIQRQFGANWLASASYIGTRTLHVWGQYPINPAVFLGFGPRTPDGVQYATCSTTA